MSDRPNYITPAGYRALRIIWLAILVLVIVLFFITRLVDVTPSSNRILFWLLLALGVIAFAASFVLKYTSLKEAVEKHNPGMVRSTYIMAFALCEATAVFGTIAYFVTGAQNYYFFFVLSGFGVLLHKPQRDDVLAATKEKL